MCDISKFYEFLYGKEQLFLFIIFTLIISIKNNCFILVRAGPLQAQLEKLAPGADFTRGVGGVLLAPGARPLAQDRLLLCLYVS